MALVALLLALSGTCNTSFAQNADVKAYQRSRNEYVFTVQISDHSELQTLTQIVSIDKVKGSEVLCFANQKEFDKLIAAGYTPTLIDNRETRATFPMWNGTGTYGYDSYLTYEDYVNLIFDYSDNYDNCELIDLGETANHNIFGVRINNGTSGKPKVLLTGGIHGNEFITTVSMMQIIDVLLNSDDNYVQELVNNLDIFILPMVNPDGTYYYDDETVSGATRENYDGIDLNRNFKDWVRGDHPDGERYYATETQMLMDLGQQYQFSLAGLFHSGGAVVNYPWDCSTTNHADRNWWEYVSAQYVATARTGDSTYMRSANDLGDTPAGYIRGADWYVVYGGHQDFMNYYCGCRAVTIEIYQDEEIYGYGAMSTYAPTTASTIKGIVDLNKDAILEYIGEALNGFKGRVCDAATGNPISNATITVNNHDSNGSTVKTDENGYYFRPIKAGTYSVTYSAPFYTSQTSTVTVTDGQSILQNINLHQDENITSINMQNGQYIVKHDINFYDSGGANANYSNNENYTFTFLPKDTHSYVKVTFSTFNTQSGSDKLIIYDGRTVEDQVVGTYSGTSVPSAYTSTSGALTFKFTSNGSNTKAGWKAVISEIADPTYSINIADGITNGMVSVSTETAYEEDEIVVTATPSEGYRIDVLYYVDSDNNHVNIDAETGEFTMPASDITIYASFVLDIGTIDFEASATTVALDEYVYFTNLTTMQFGDDFCRWTLEGADPETTGATNPIVQYHNPGTYDVTFAILDEDGNVLYSLTKEDYITVENAYLMHNGNTTTCDTKFYDNGGANGTYTASQNTVFTFYPGGGERSRIQAEFVSFNTEGDNWDVLKVYDGTVANSSLLIGSYSGNTNPGTIVATNPEGALTFKFTSDRANCYDGWEANITCIAPNYEIACAESVNGSISTDLQMAFAGETINVTVTPNEGYNLESLYYLDADNNQTDIDLHMLAFAMPAKNVTVYATFSTMATQQHDINISNGSSIADNVLFYDHGGPNANYSNRENYTYTFTPAVPGGFVQVEFLEFATESKYDKLTVSDGNGTIATLSGSNLPSRIISSTGSLTFKFTSDNSVNRTGWKAEVTTFVYQQYQIAVANVENGTITADKTAAFAGETVTLTATPSDGHFFAGWNVTCGSETIQVVNNQFIMPAGNVNVSATFTQGYYTPAHYELITNANDLETGCKFILATGNNGNVKAIGGQNVEVLNYGGTYYFDYFRDAVSATAQAGEGNFANTIYLNDHQGAAEFYLYGSTNNWSFYDEDESGYLYCYRNKNNPYTYGYDLNTIASSSYRYWDITFYTGGAVRIRNTKYVEDMGFESNQFDVFSATSQKRLYLYKEVEGYWTAGERPSRDNEITAVSENEVNARLYPNPTTGNLTIEAEGMNHISVFNLMGQMVYDMDVDTDNMTLDMSQFNTAGMYLVRINTANGVKTERVTVTK